MQKSNKIYKIVLSIFIIALFSFQLSFTNAAETPPQLNIVIDASGSMGQKMEGSKTKMDIAKEAVGSLVDSLPASSYVGLRAYGSQSVESVKNCTDTKQLVPISILNKTEIKNQVNALTPKGWTLMAYALQKAYDDFVSSESERVIVLVSDGEETCGGNLCQVAKDLEAKGVTLTVNTIGFNVNAKAKSELTCVAEATGGKYYDAANTNQLNSSLVSATQKIKDFKDYTTVGEEITGGSGFENAPTIEPNKSYIFDILTKETQFFKVSIPKNEEFKLLSVSAKNTNYTSGPCSNSINMDVVGANYENLGRQGWILIQNSDVGTSAKEPDWQVKDYLNAGNTDLYFKISDESYGGCKSLVHVTLKVVTNASTTTQTQSPVLADQQDLGQTQQQTQSENPQDQINNDSLSQTALDMDETGTPEKSNLPLFIGIVALVALIIGGAVFYLIKKGGSKPPTFGGGIPARPPTVTPPPPPAPPPPSAPSPPQT